ncbi:protein kinase [Acaryochloris sp. 'Moss Beach']|uniref:FHA domain-containing serine/threonine-protein kinase n=1 Tax=Acaryochloris sp. 'Moss Beach' TaxID=2740837 RepID=UPI001F28669D|nr:FHA domain-containing serine/threonine-protein kinase [Acaryochloris sp. 'Moss Beach']UJB69197.1 protein kinase [Acaryochloris sp. 'Moss Beach']
MVTLTLLDPTNKAPIKQWLFTTSKQINIGRSSDNHIVLRDILVSRYHLELRLSKQLESSFTWQLHSLGSNGTFVNGKLTNQAELKDDTIIQLGLTGPILRFQQQLPYQIGAKRQSATTRSQNSSCSHEGNLPGNLFCVHCGQSLKVLQTLGPYEVMKVIGMGGMGTTFLVRHQDDKSQKPQLQVLKEMNADMEKIPKAQELFKREARMLRSLQHSGIPRLYDFFTENDKQYLVMELIHGQDLDRWVNQHGPLPPHQVLQWMIQACDILDYIHCHNPPIIHRDLKPGNILVRNRDSQVFIIDFGAVKEASLVPGTRIAVEGYSAPEQGLGRPTIQSDLYGIGATLLFLITGQSPLQFYKNLGHGYRIELANILSIPTQIKAIIEKVTHPHPDHRFQTAKELQQALKNCL